MGPSVEKLHQNIEIHEIIIKRFLNDIFTIEFSFSPESNIIVDSFKPGEKITIKVPVITPEATEN